MKFKLWAEIDNPHFLRNLLSILSSQCSYSFDVFWYVKSTVPLPEISKILSDTCEQLKGLMSMELEISVADLNNICHTCCMSAVTIPRMNKCLFVDSYLDKKMVIGYERKSFLLYNIDVLYYFRQNRWSNDTRTSNIQLFQYNEIRMCERYNEINGEFLCSSPPIISWHQITSIDIPQLFNSTLLHRLISQLTNIRKLQVEYLDRGDHEPRLKEETLINILNDGSLCAMLMANGLREFNISVQKAAFTSNSVEIANLIVERLFRLEIMKLDGFSDQLLEMTPILINGLPKLSFFTFVGNLEEGKINEKKLHDLQNSITRPFRTEVPNTLEDNEVLIWL
jgi:hypothetical protein